MKSAIRRHHRIRLYSLRRMRMSWVRDIEERYGYERAARYIDTPHPCSCRGCGNQRFWEGPTVQERRSVAWLEAV